MASIFDMLGGLLGVGDGGDVTMPMGQVTQIPQITPSFSGGLQNGLTKLFNQPNQLPQMQATQTPTSMMPLPISPESLGGVTDPIEKEKLRKLMLLQYMMKNGEQSAPQQGMPQGGQQSMGVSQQGGQMKMPQAAQLSSFPSQMPQRQNFIGRGGSGY